MITLGNEKRLDFREYFKKSSAELNMQEWIYDGIDR